MNQSSNFVRGYGGYKFNDDQLNYLELVRQDIDAIEILTPYSILNYDQSVLKTVEYQNYIYFNRLQVNATGGEAAVGLATPFYKLLSEMVSDFNNGEDHLVGYSSTQNIPNSPELDQSSLNWIKGAQGVNSLEGYQGTFIQEYTKLQYSLRFSDKTPDEVSRLGQIASNEIGQSVLNDIIDNGNFPDIIGIGAADAGSVANGVFKGDYAPWAGTILFPWLSVDKFTQDWLLPDDPTQQVFGSIENNNLVDNVIFKSSLGSYDLFSAIYSANDIAFKSASGSLDFWTPLITAFGNPPLVTNNDNTDLKQDIYEWISKYYDVLQEDVEKLFGSTLSFLGVEANLIDEYITDRNSVSVGHRENADFKESNFDTDDDYLIHLGGGDDLFQASYDIISLYSFNGLRISDGGSGFDIADFREVGISGSHLDSDFIFNFAISEINSTYTYEYFIDVSSFYRDDQISYELFNEKLFSYEKLNLTNFDDILEFDILNLESIREAGSGVDLIVDAGSSAKDGDTIDLSNIQSSLDIKGIKIETFINEDDLASHKIEILDHKFNDFENVILSSARDKVYIEGGVSGNLSLGSKRSAFVDTAAGDDLVILESANDHLLLGGAGFDTLDMRNIAGDFSIEIGVDIYDYFNETFHDLAGATPEYIYIFNGPESVLISSFEDIINNNGFNNLTLNGRDSWIISNGYVIGSAGEDYTSSGINVGHINSVVTFDSNDIFIFDGDKYDNTEDDYFLTSYGGGIDTFYLENGVFHIDAFDEGGDSLIYVDGNLIIGDFAITSMIGENRFSSVVFRGAALLATMNYSEFENGSGNLRITTRNTTVIINDFTDGDYGIRFSDEFLYTYLTSPIVIAPDIGNEIISYFENGNSTVNSFSGGLIRATTINDLSDSADWTSQRKQFDLDGVIASQANIYDDGRVLDIAFEAGLKTQANMVDNGDAHAWSNYVDLYDENGDRTDREMTYDDGRMLNVAFENGLKTQADMIDINDAHAWASYTDLHDQNGDLASRETIYDDGRIQQATYVSGVLSASLISDDADQFEWTTVEKQFDLDGVIASQANIYDDGRVLDIAFEAGLKTQANMVDNGDAHAWSNYVDLYDENGDRTDREMTYDDGRVVLTVFDDLVIV